MRTFSLLIVFMACSITVKSQVVENLLPLPALPVIKIESQQTQPIPSAPGPLTPPQPYLPLPPSVPKLEQDVQQSGTIQPVIPLIQDNVQIPLAKEGIKATTWHLKSKLREPAAGDNELQRLLIERYNEAVKELNAKMSAYNNGTIAFGDLMDTSTRLLHAELELGNKPEDQIAALEAYLDLAKHQELRIKALYDSAARGGESDKYHQTRYMRIDAEIQLLRAKQKAGLAK